MLRVRGEDATDVLTYILQSVQPLQSSPFSLVYVHIKCSYIILPLFLLLLNFLELLQVSLGHLNHIVCFLLRDHQGRGEGTRPTIKGGACGGSGQALPQIFTHGLAFQKFSSEGSHMFNLSFSFIFGRLISKPNGYCRLNDMFLAPLKGNLHKKY